MKTLMKRHSKGFVLIFALLTAAISLVLLIPYISRVVTDYRFTAKIHNSTAALNLAEAGIERALWEIRWNGSIFSGWSTTSDGYAISVNSFSTLANQSIGDYDVDVSVSLDGMIATIISTGYAPNRTSNHEERTIRVKYENHNFGMAVRAVGSGPGAITLGVQDKMDSYNSALGTYDATHMDSNGDIATNGSIVFGTMAKVWGDANPGADYPFSSQPSNVDGAWGTLQAPLTVDPIPPETLAAASAANSNSNIQKGDVSDPDPLAGNALTVAQGKTVTLPGGTYYFTSIDVAKQGNLIVSGPSIIYIDGGDINVNTQGDINNLGVPRNMMIYSTGDIINLTTQADFYGAIYAPNAAVSLTVQGDIFGAVTCSKFTGGVQAGVHFDMDLLNVSPVFSNNGVTSWQEIQ